MKELKLSNSSKKLLLDDEDFERCLPFSWCIGKTHGSLTITAWMPLLKRTLSIGRFILSYDGSCQVDHKNRNVLDNQRSNLRIATDSQNRINTQKRKGTTSQFRGVWFCRGKWMAYISFNGKRKYLGLYKTEAAAAKVYDRAAIEFHQEFAILNFPENVKKGVQ